MNPKNPNQTNSQAGLQSYQADRVPFNSAAAEVKEANPEPAPAEQPVPITKVPGFESEAKVIELPVDSVKINVEQADSSAEVIPLRPVISAEDVPTSKE